jgi:CubicO group peptidase (beta-lactamase class C family)
MSGGDRMKRRSFLAASTACMTASLFSRYGLAATTQNLDVLAQRTRAELKTPGLAYGLVRPDGSTLAGALGVRKLGEADPIRTSTLFHMASVTKPFVATAIAQRIERGRLRLDQRLYDALPGFSMADPRASSITLEQVLTHSAGLPDVVDYEWEKPETDADALKRYVAGLSDRKLLFAPGTAFEYSNIGFELLARVIEVIDGVSFEQAVRNTILQPLRMQRSTLFYPEADKTQVATPHVLDKQGKVSVSEVFPYNRRHAGSSTLLSNVDDMLRWIRVNLGDGAVDGVRIMSPETARNLRTPRSVAVKEGGSVPAGTKLGLSWFVIPRAGREIVAHGGVDLGFVSICAMSPRDRCGVVAMANCVGEQETGPLLQFALAVMDEQASTS